MTVPVFSDEDWIELAALVLLFANEQPATPPPSYASVVESFPWRRPPPPYYLDALAWLSGQRAMGQARA